MSTSPSQPNLGIVAKDYNDISRQDVVQDVAVDIG